MKTYNISKMSDQENKEQILFELPCEGFDAIPINLEDRINIGFMEIGIRPKGKHGQLRYKKQLFLKYWGDKYKKELGINWIPQSYKILAHYNPDQRTYMNEKKFGIDVLLLYSDITEEMISELTEAQQSYLIDLVKDSTQKKIITNIFDNDDSERLSYYLFKNYAGELSDFRGELAEFIVFNDIYNSCLSDTTFLRNIEIKYKNKKYNYRPPEIDGIFIFHNQDSYSNLISQLNKIKHIQITERK